MKVRVILHGRVQGVGFRFWLQGEAKSLALTGWVRNRREGSVEALVCGPETAVEALLQLCKKGPRFSRVENVERFPAEDEPGADFEIRPSL